jgi:Leucine-rich repeat (LRR) protein
MLSCLKYYLFTIFLLSTFLLSQECDSGFVWIEDVPSCCGAAAEHCFFESDLNILQQIIDNSSETINMLLDDNEDGILEPVELGFSEWYGGRLVALDCFLSDIMNCNLSGSLPENIGDLDSLEALWINGSDLSGQIPQSIGELENIELLYLANNKLTGNIPESICNLDLDFSGENNWGVEYFTIEGNRLCPEYPSCLDPEVIGAQDCVEFSGDVNGDSLLNILDIVIIANIILDSEEFIIDADINLDGYVNILDIVSLAEMILNDIDG